MDFELCPAGLEDAEDITRLFQIAFKDNHIIGFFHPHTPAHLVWEKDIKNFSDMIAQGDVYGGRWTKIVEVATGKTVAFSKWVHPHTLTEEQKKEKEKRELEKRNGPHLEGSNGPLIDEFVKQLFAGREKWIVPEKTYFLHYLAVDPDYQRRGLGNMLIRSGLETVDKARAPAYVEASPIGFPLYLKHGWQPVDQVVIDMRPYGGKGIERQNLLMRKPRGSNEAGKASGMG
ncbi:hypothetical protein ACLMJK_001890 [Lecanora helva]